MTRRSTLFSAGSLLGCLIAGIILNPASLDAQQVGGLGGAEKFKQLGAELPTPNDYRTASGAPGKNYWQQRVDYAIDVTLDDRRQRITGSESITYHNNSPDTLRFLWLQLDQNIYEPNSVANLARSGKVGTGVRASSITTIGGVPSDSNWFGGYRIASVTTATGAKLNYAINGTMMRVELATPLPPGLTRVVRIAWSFPVLPTTTPIAQGNPPSVQEFFPRDSNYEYNIAQWYPRLSD